MWITEIKTESSDCDKIESNPSNWKKIELKNFETNVSRITWSLDGNSLGVSTLDGISYVFKETAENCWNCVSFTNSEGVMEFNEKDK